MNDPDVLLVVNVDTGVAINAIVVGPGWGPPDGHVTLPPTDGAWIGWIRTGDGWLPPPPDGS